jgi:hypothetical protein
VLFRSVGLLATACAPGDTAWLAPDDEDLDVPRDALRTRAARVDTSLVPGSGTPFAYEAAPERVRLPLFDDLQVDAVLDRLVQPGEATVWVGHVEGRPDHEVVLSRVRDHVAGLVRTPAQVVRLRPRGPGQVAVDELRPGRVSGDLPPLLPLDLPEEPELVGDAPLHDGTAPVVDVLVAVTAPVATALGGASGVEAMAASLVAQTNAGWSSAGLEAEVRLAGVHLSPWEETAFDFRDTLTGLADADDGLLDDVAEARDDAGADLVSLIVEGDDSACGLAYLMSRPSPAFASAAYSVVARSCAGSRLSFAHELGHLLGSQHDRANAGPAPAYPYAYGHRDVDAGFRTVMAYRCPTGPCPRINRWSHADQTLEGAALGVAIGSDEAAHNAASLSLTAPVAEAFRPRASEADGEAATLLLPEDGATLGGADASFTWSDAGADAYQLTLGSAEGGADLARIEAGTDLSTTVTGLPTDGRTLHATLWTRHGDDWSRDAATYTAATVATGPASLSSPAPGSILPARTTFSWGDVGADSYALVLGSSRFGTDLGTWGTTGTSVTVSGLPTDGRTVWATLYTQDGGRWLGETVTYQAGVGTLDDRPARLLEPAPGTWLTGRSFTFRWTDARASRYALTLYSDDGEVYHDIVAGTSARVSLSPAVASGTLRVRLATELGGRWYARNETYELE